MNRSLFHDSDVEIAVFDRSGELAVLEGRPHRDVLARWNPPLEDQRLRAAAHRRTHGPHENVVLTRWAQPDATDLSHAGLAHPERKGIHGHQVWPPSTSDQSMIRPP